ncbi:LysR family transcriptional regulator [Bordetella genomosp. 9]|uniref:LysR family transcriptional regulator n=1 Tax=Bordetella genomosp. 9 TaxID=1416803 RepID=A0A1W6Z5D1_9BORD|nr:LysR family transcriptional regulator [Bordetella genomosp. 9]ARP88570.1 LysR family transcriptional regulator [Bordetella genomosp. 9]ARP92537.1 LysR family transcriptional regulator [Bordetella genomosp. 9]
MDLSALQMLVAAVEERSLAKAGEREHLVTSAASKRISELERQVGTTLLVRHNRGVEPTPAGAALYHKAKAILTSVRTLQDMCEEFSPDGIPKIRLAANRSAIVQFLPADIRAFQAESPKSRLDLVEAYSGDIPRMVSNQEVDIGIYHAAGAAPGVMSYPYRTDRVVLVVPVGHPLSQAAGLHLDEARSYDFLGYFPRHSFEAFLELAGPTLTGPLNVKIQVANYEARCRMVREGLGIAVMPELIADTYLGLLGLVKVPLLDEWARRQFYVCARDRAHMRMAAGDLFDFLVGIGRPAA